MKKVAILTHCVANNYGANLQALSTAFYLKNHGYEPYFICWNDYIKNNTIPEQAFIHENFLKTYGFKISPPCRSDKDFVDLFENEKIKYVIVGSDCVLTYNSNVFPFRLTRRGFKKIKKAQDYEFPNPFWLSYLKDKKDVIRCMMSGSCGSSSYQGIKDEIKRSMGELIEKFDYFSVRDHYTKNFVNKILPNYSVHITPDPVFGFNGNNIPLPSEKEIRSKYLIEGDYFVLSFYAQNWPSQKWADKFRFSAHLNGFKCVSLQMPQGGRRSSFDVDIELPLDPIDWYCLIKYSKGYVGNNMHPIIVSIHNCVPFYSFNIHGSFYLQGRLQNVRTSKEYDILKSCGLLNFMIPQSLHMFSSPSKIVSLLSDFNVASCEKESLRLQMEYDIMMEKIISLFD